MEKTIAAVDKFKPYDDTQFKERQQAFEIEIKSLKERQLALAEQAVRVAEKSSDAIALAKETRAIANGSAAEAAASSREVQGRLAALKQEIDSTVAALRIEMTSLKRATSNPLSK